MFILRGVIIIFGAFSTLKALSMITLADFYGIVFMSPFLVTIMSVLILKEKIGIHRIAALIGFIGVLILAGPQMNSSPEGLFWVFIATFLGSSSTILIRKIGREKVTAIFAFVPAFSTMVIYVPLALVMHEKLHIPATAWELAYPFLLGTLGFFGFMAYNEFGDSVHLAHEFGHAFDLGEVGELFNDPVTGITQTREDMWDMFYCPGTSASTPNRYYTSWSDSLSAPACTAPGGRAALTPGALLPNCVSNALSSCTAAPGAALLPGQLSCKLEGVPGSGYCEAKSHGSAALYNNITFSSPGTSGTRLGPNIMGYVTGPHRSFSPSQVRPTARAPDVQAEQPGMVSGIADGQIHATPDGAG